MFGASEGDPGYIAPSPRVTFQTQESLDCGDSEEDDCDIKPCEYEEKLHEVDEKEITFEGKAKTKVKLKKCTIL